VVVETVTREDAVGMTRSMIERAKKGSESAARLVYQYVLGRPLAGMSPDWVEHDEWELRMARPSPAEFQTGCFSRKPIELANIMGQAMDYKWNTEAGWQIRESLEKDKRKAESLRRRAAAREKNTQVPKSQ
jgi:hypothetical protein